jgi:hypothetical protein
MLACEQPPVPPLPREARLHFEEGARHSLVRRGDRMAALPRHGGAKQLGTGLMKAIKKELAIED